MAEKRSAQVVFRTSPQNRERLEKAQELGFSMSDILNEILDKHFDQHFTNAAKERVQKLQKALATR